MDLLTALVGGCNPIGLVFEAKANAFSQVLGPAAVVEVSFQVLEVLVFSDGRGDPPRLRSGLRQEQGRFLTG